MRPLPSGWEWRKLGKVAKIINGSTPDTNQPEFWDGDILWVTPTDVGRLTTIEIFDTERKITQAGLDSCSATMLPAGAVLMTSRAPVGNLAIAGKPLCTNQGFKSFVPKEGLNNRYLYFALQYFVPDLQKISHGNTFTEITKEMLMDFYVPIPIEEKEQQRIASCLETQMAEAQRLQHAAERQLGSAISLPKNIVNHEMNQAGNQEGYLIDVLRSIPTSGWPHAYGNELEGIPFLTLTAVLNFQYDGTQVKYTDTPVNQNGDYWAQPGDIFMSRSNTPELVGQAAIYNGTPARVIYPDLLIRIQPDLSKADIRFVHYWLMSQSARKYITSNARGSSGTMKKITLEMVRSIPFPSHLEKEQQRHIADDIDQKVVIAKNLLAAADKQVEAANALPNSFLIATFGGFVPPIEE